MSSSRKRPAPGSSPAKTATATGRGRLVKRYRRPARNQFKILDQEVGWLAKIDDPLEPSHGLDSSARLREAVFKLDRGQKWRILLFETDGSGEGVTLRVSHCAWAFGNGSATDETLTMACGVGQSTHFSL